VTPDAPRQAESECTDEGADQADRVVAEVPVRQPGNAAQSGTAALRTRQPAMTARRLSRQASQGRATRRQRREGDEEQRQRRGGAVGERLNLLSRPVQEERVHPCQQLHCGQFLHMHPRRPRRDQAIRPESLGSVGRALRSPRLHSDLSVLIRPLVPRPIVRRTGPKPLVSVVAAGEPGGRRERRVVIPRRGLVRMSFPHRCRSEARRVWILATGAPTGVCTEARASPATEARPVRRA
jgi:hypothetical protein